MQFIVIVITINDKTIKFLLFMRLESHLFEFSTKINLT